MVSLFSKQINYINAPLGNGQKAEEAIFFFFFFSPIKTSIKMKNPHSVIYWPIITITLALKW